MLDGTTAILGDDAGVRAAFPKWNRESPLSEPATEARNLEATDDAWFLMVKPFAKSLPAQPAGQEGTQARVAPKHLAEFVDVVEEASGGVRFGANLRAHLDVRAKTADDAYSLAALGRWLPRLLQAMNPGGRESRLVDLAEELTVSAAGRTVTLSFALPEDKLLELFQQTDIVEE